MQEPDKLTGSSLVETCGVKGSGDTFAQSAGDQGPLSDGMGSFWPGSGCGQTWSVGMIHSSPMAVWRGRVTM
jgi:hypothetical protein